MDLFWQPTVFPYSRPFVDGWTLTIEKYDIKCTIHDEKYHRIYKEPYEVVFHKEWTPIPIKFTDLLDDMKNGSNFCTDCVCECCLPIVSEEMLKDPHRPVKIFMHSEYFDTHPLSKSICDRFNIDPGYKTKHHPFQLQEGCNERNSIVEFRFVNSDQLQYRHYYAFLGDSLHHLCHVFQKSIITFPHVHHLTFRDVTRLTLFLSRPPFDFPDELLSLIFEYIVSSPEKWLT